jgi:drug/metabolite transporter (DMT)-like permease
MTTISGAAIGIPLALVATSSYSVGLILEKRALDRMPEIDLRHVLRVIVRLLTNPAWLAGFALMLTGLACQTVVLTFEPVSVVQPVLASGVVVVLVLSRLVLRERLGGGEFWCVAAVAVSVVLLAISVTGTSGEAGHRTSAGAMAAVAIPSAIVGLLVAAAPLRGRDSKHRPPATGVCFGLGTGLLYGVAALATKALSGILVHQHGAAAIAAGLISSPYLYLFGGCTVTAMLLYQAGLQACRASILIPVSNITGSAYFMIAGTWLFHEHLPSSPVKLALRLTGIVVTALVLIVLSRRAPREAPQEAPRPLAGSRTP